MEEHSFLCPEGYLHLQRPNHNLPLQCLFLSAQPLITKLEINLLQVFHFLVLDHVNYYLHLATNKIVPQFFRWKMDGVIIETFPRCPP